MDKRRSFGVRVAEALDAAYDFPDDVQVLDGGTLGMELLRFITGTEKLLILEETVSLLFDRDYKG